MVKKLAKSLKEEKRQGDKVIQFVLFLFFSPFLSCGWQRTFCAYLLQQLTIIASHLQALLLAASC